MILLPKLNGSQGRKTLEQKTLGRTGFNSGGAGRTRMPARLAGGNTTTKGLTGPKEGRSEGRAAGECPRSPWRLLVLLLCAGVVGVFQHVLASAVRRFLRRSRERLPEELGAAGAQTCRAPKWARPGFLVWEVVLCERYKHKLAGSHWEYSSDPALMLLPRVFFWRLCDGAFAFRR